MRIGLPASIALHLAAAGVAVLPMLDIWRTKVVSEPFVPISLIAEAELAERTSVPARAPRPKPEVEKEPEPPAPEPEPEPEPQTAPEPAPEPEPEAPAPDPVPEKQPETQKPPEKKPERKQDDLDLDRLAAVVDKSRKDADQGAPPEDAEEADEAQPGVGAGDRLTASDLAKMRAAVARCWSVTALAGAPDANKLVVAIEIELNRDGTLQGAPRVANAIQINLSGNRFWKVAEQTALRAVSSCQPYDFLAQDRYDAWREMELVFDPSQMAGY